MAWTARCSLASTYWHGSGNLPWRCVSQNRQNRAMIAMRLKFFYLLGKCTKNVPFESCLLMCTHEFVAHSTRAWFRTSESSISYRDYIRQWNWWAKMLTLPSGVISVGQSATKYSVAVLLHIALSLAWLLAGYISDLHPMHSRNRGRG